MNNQNLTKHFCKQLSSLLVYLAGNDREKVLKGLLKTQHSLINLVLKAEVYDGIDELRIRFVVRDRMEDNYEVRILLPKHQSLIWQGEFKQWLGELVVVPVDTAAVSDLKYVRELPLISDPHLLKDHLLNDVRLSDDGHFTFKNPYIEGGYSSIPCVVAEE